MTAYAFILPFGFAISFAMAWLVRHAGILDHPNNRSSHSSPTPRSGGLAIIASVAACAIGWTVLTGAPPGVGVALSAMAAAGLLGFIDDLISSGPAEKFLALMAISLAAAFAAGPVLALDFGFATLALPFAIGLAGTALWVFTAINVVNFADGSNGLVAGSMAMAGLGLTLVSGEPAGLFLSGALLGFLPWNAPRARLFLGDVGALAIGGWFAVAGLNAVTGPEGISVLLVPLLMLPLLVDILLTLLARVRAGFSITQPHRSHGYQILVRMGVPHWRVALIYGAVTGGCAILALVAHAQGGVWPIVSLLLMSLVLGVAHTRIRSGAKVKGLDLGE
ncbi:MULTISPECIES: glycosyltransferase family 4 protein [Hyphobacterium]|uniref:Glycosyltransferase family 4 protein n=1 Tax=Hyphobacterium vulgare TaxID=1736751 RepID=A0ABV6ZYM1_9PROT